MMHFPKVGIIFLTFPTKNWEQDISRCMESFERLDYPIDRLELICVESNPNSPPIAEWFNRHWMMKSGTALPRITYILKNDYLGFSANNNLGYEKAKELGCDYIQLINEDAYVAPECVLRAVECAERNPSIAIVQSLVLLGQDPDKVNSIGNAFHYLGFGYSKGYLWTKERALNFLAVERHNNSLLEIGYASGAAALLRVKAIDEVGTLFDEGFYSYHEDTDVTLQTRIRGWNIVIEPRSVVYHNYEFAKKKINYYWMERNRYVLVFSYYRPWTLLLLFPMIIALDIAILFFSLKGGWFRMKVRVYRDWFSPTYWRWIVSRRRAIQSARKISDRTLLSYSTSRIEFQERAVENPVLKYIGNPILSLYWKIMRSLV